MGVPEIDPQTRGLIPLRFCEHNHIIPLRLDGRRLTVAASHPDSYDLKIVLAGLPQNQALGPTVRVQHQALVTCAAVGIVVVLIAIVACWAGGGRTREFRADARAVLKQFERIDSRLEVGVNYTVFTGMVADLHQSMNDFREKHEAYFGTEAVFEDLEAAEQAYIDSVDIWRDKIDASEYDDHDYEGDLQDCWHKASDALDRARDELDE